MSPSSGHRKSHTTLNEMFTNMNRSEDHRYILNYIELFTVLGLCFFPFV